ncbi:Carbohydrate-selective porin, OprB family [Massilia sp. PDC64]|nr:carbohydrate porin [Massilia sp. PDC64]SDC18046.1 Carbohydrate-selective porin, OprB family [Massilia sp. PDC64]
MFRSSLFYLAACLTAAAPSARADEAWNAHVQATYVWQAKPAFAAAYTGPASLAPWRETGYSFSATAAFGVRPWAGAELYFDPEVVQGKAMSGLHGLGGMTNGEEQKTSGTSPTFYRARLFLRQTWNLGGELQPVASDMNQLAGSVASRRVVLTAGNLAVSDIFDANSQAHDARSQFLDWALVAHGAWDFAADARGYTWGAALEYYDGDWAVRAGRFLLPRESNGLPLDPRIFRHHGDQVELEHHHAWLGQPGTVRMLAFRDRARMGSFRDALAAAAPGEAPDVATVRRERGKTGFGLSLDQVLNDRVAMFARASRNDGQSETYAFAEIERSLSVGATVQVRAGDTLGVALVRNGLSQAHRDYLAAGGVGAFIGDGRLDYHPEQIAEAYYKIGLGAYAALSLDWQHIANPAYNGARGPVDVYGVRLHAQH